MRKSRWVMVGGDFITIGRGRTAIRVDAAASLLLLNSLSPLAYNSPVAVPPLFSVKHARVLPGIVPSRSLRASFFVGKQYGVGGSTVGPLSPSGRGEGSLWIRK